MRDALDRGATTVTGGGCRDRPGYFVEPGGGIKGRDGGRAGIEELLGPSISVLVRR